MTRLLRTALLATVLMAMAAPVALADSSTWRQRELDCGAAGTMIVRMPPSMFTTPAIVPFHDVASTAVVVPFWVRVTSTDPADPWVWNARAKPAATNHADRLVSCEYTDPAGLFIEVVGLLTPGR